MNTSTAERLGMNRVDITDWIRKNEPDSKYWAARNWDHQVCFVRDKLGMLLSSPGYPRGAPVWQVGGHTSKSVLFPVYLIETPACDLILRDNLHDWKVSVISHRGPLKLDLRPMTLDFQVSPTCCEGFEPSWIFGPYSKNQEQFTAELYTDEQLYVMCHQITRQFYHLFDRSFV